MSFRRNRHASLALRGLAALAIVFSFGLIGRTSGVTAAPVQPFCTARPQLCTETMNPWNYKGQYTGHDEPSLLFYSNVPGSGNSNFYQLTLPKDPPTPPNENGTGGVWNFMLHPAFWFGMALCDNQSAPDPGATCTPDSDTNIHTGTNPSSPDYMGNTPGTAFMEMQFYPPNWGSLGTGVSCGPDSTEWCAALNIDSWSQNSNTGQYNNNACLDEAGVEYVNYAIITRSGNSQAPADPLRQTLTTFSTTPDTLEMNPGDRLTVNMHDTPAGLQVVIHDLTTGQTGSMTASIANGFGHPLYQPSANTCTDQPYAFHPMYSTSTPSTRVLWAAHSYNVAYSDEIGHFEYCSAATGEYGVCSTPGATDISGTDEDDYNCFIDPVDSVLSSFTGCLGEDNDFDGVPYQHNWPGSSLNPTTDAQLHATPITFTSPVFTSSTGPRNYSQVAFENDLPRIEGSDFSSNNDCQRHIAPNPDPHPGQGCVDPPNGASFYPMFTTATSPVGECVWREGDVHVPGTLATFGGTPTAEYGGLQDQYYPDTGYTVSQIYETFHRSLTTTTGQPSNPCPANIVPGQTP